MKVKVYDSKGRKVDKIGRSSENMQSDFERWVVGLVEFLRRLEEQQATAEEAGKDDETR